MVKFYFGYGHIMYTINYINNNYIFMKSHTILLFLVLAYITYADVPGDKVSPVPGYPEDYNTSVYSGYLNVSSQTRQMHYVFVESRQGANNQDPVTLWLNGGPGCSSMLGFLQQIGPYYLQDGKDYRQGDMLTFNPYSWHNVSNLLFLQSPTGVGYSYNLDDKYENNDYNTANDNLNAVVDFFSKFPEYKNRAFWIAGQSYAGRYIPDLAVLIDRLNTISGSRVINMKGILVGNGVMTFKNGQLQNSQAQYLIDHSFVDPDLLPYWKTSCQVDPDSAGCQFFHTMLQQNTAQLNPYNVYGYCYYNDSFDTSQKIPGKQKPEVFQSQQSLLMKSIAKQTNTTVRPRFNGAPCAYFDGVYDYFNINEVAYHAKFSQQKWNGPCAQNISYTIDLTGSIHSYQTLLSRSIEEKYQIILYNGDWDDVVPYVDTYKGIKLLNLHESYIYQSWFTDGQHSGFHQLFNGLLFVLVKGASHQVPQAKRPEAFGLFRDALQGHKDVWKMIQKQKAKKRIIQE